MGSTGIPGFNVHALCTSWSGADSNASRRESKEGTSEYAFLIIATAVSSLTSSGRFLEHIFRAKSGYAPERKKRG